MTDPGPRSRVVIVGAGFGGLAAVQALRHADVAVTLIDRENHHAFQPLLYQVATAALSSTEIAWPVRGLLRQSNLTIVMAEMRAVDVARRIVATDGPSFPFDTLVLATGSTHSYFGNESWAPFAPGLKRVADAEALRARILLAFERAELATDHAERARLLTFVVVGGGATGVEMSGAIAELARDTLRHDYRVIDSTSARIILVEAGPRVLPTMPDSLSDYALAAIRRIGVDVRLGVRVTGCDAHGVDTSEGRIDSATLIWAAGVQASPAAVWLGIAPGRNGRVPVGADLTVAGHPDIYAIGDTAAAARPDGGPVPGVAPAAKQMGRYVGRRIAAAAASRPIEPRFAYRDQGELATIGRNAAVVRIGRVKLTGRIAWLFWSVAHIFFLVTLRDRVVVSLDWLWSYATHGRAARVVTRREDGRSA